MTTQARDILIYNKDEQYIFADPLISYLESVGLRNHFVPPGSFCWKGYFSKWGIDNKKLFLIEWKGYIDNYEEVGIDYLFPGEEIVFAKWFTGEIRIALGEITYSQTFHFYTDGDLYLIFENGVLVNEYIKLLSEEKKEIMKRYMKPK